MRKRNLGDIVWIDAQAPAALSLILQLQEIDLDPVVVLLYKNTVCLFPNACSENEIKEGYKWGKECEAVFFRWLAKNE